MSATKRKVIEARKAVREKLRQLRSSHSDRELALRETFKPITESLGQISGKLRDDDPIADFINQHSQGTIDRIFGVGRVKPYTLGSLPIWVSDSKIQIGDREFERTPGLMNLIFLRPTQSVYFTPKDMETYGEILHLTGVHKKADGSVKSSSSLKYRKVIKPILDAERHSSGSGIDIQHKVLTRLPSQYIYYDDPNELIDRLRLLMASGVAGNKSHSNEIISIISELRERGIIE